MADKAHTSLAAHTLMKCALELLDEIDEDGVSLHLQQAIDALAGVPIPQTLEAVERALDSPEAQRILARMERRIALSEETMTGN